MGNPIDKLPPASLFAAPPPVEQGRGEVGEGRGPSQQGGKNDGKDEFSRKRPPNLVPPPPRADLGGITSRRTVETTLLRTLDLAVAPAADRPRHLAAGSGLIVRGERAFVVADDELQLGVFSVNGKTPGELIRLRPGELPAEAAARKKAKPDFESLSSLDATVYPPHGALLAVGSDSRPTRRSAVLVPLGADGLPSGAPTTIDLTSLYTDLLKRFPQLNIEGSTVVGDRLILAQRGNGATGQNALIELDLPAFLSAARRGVGVGPEVVRGVVDVDLGQLQGVRLGFTDLSALPDGRLVFIGAAEVTDDPYHDGEVKGSVAGIIGRDGTVRDMVVLGPNMKAEGVQARLVGDAVELLVVTDADDPTRPSELRRARVTFAP